MLMRRSVKFIVMVAIIGIACYGVCLSSSNDGQRAIRSALFLDDIESLARGELPEVEIVCGSSENKGRCWDGDCEPFYTPFGFAKAWDCYRATGNINDVCVQDAPCL